MDRWIDEWMNWFEQLVHKHRTLSSTLTCCLVLMTIVLGNKLLSMIIDCDKYDDDDDDEDDDDDDDDRMMGIDSTFGESNWSSCDVKTSTKKKTTKNNKLQHFVLLHNNILMQQHINTTTNKLPTIRCLNIVYLD